MCVCACQSVYEHVRLCKWNCALLKICQPTKLNVKVPSVNSTNYVNVCQSMLEVKSSNKCTVIFCSMFVRSVCICIDVMSCVRVA